MFYEVFNKPDDYRDYARDPSVWLKASRLQRRAGDQLWSTFSQLYQKIGGDDEELNEEARACAMGSMLHYGFAVENAAKAALISRDPEILRGGRIMPMAFAKGGGHDIPGLVQKALEHAPLSDAEKVLVKRCESTELLRRLLAFVIWASRYPVPLEVGRMQETRRFVQSDDPTLVDGVLRALEDRVSI